MVSFPTTMPWRLPNLRVEKSPAAHIYPLAPTIKTCEDAALAYRVRLEAAIKGRRSWRIRPISYLSVKVMGSYYDQPLLVYVVGYIDPIGGKASEQLRRQFREMIYQIDWTDLATGRPCALVCSYDDCLSNHAAPRAQTTFKLPRPWYQRLIYGA